jgi:hypothetical protein
MNYQTTTGWIEMLIKNLKVIVILICLSTFGCSSQSRQAGGLKPEIDINKVPEYFSIQIVVKDSITKSHQLRDIYITDIIPDLYYSHKGFYAEKLVLVFRSNKFYGSQWLASVPFKHLDDKININGAFLVEAIRYDRGLKLSVDRWVPPPTALAWNVIFKEKKIVNQFISHPQREWGQFNYHNKDTLNKVVTLMNNNYEGCLWRGQYGKRGEPVRNGKVVVTLKLMEDVCEKRAFKN